MYYIEDNDIKEVTVLEIYESSYLVQDNNAIIYKVPKYMCYESKDTAIKILYSDLQVDIKEAKWCFELAQKNLKAATQILEEFKQKYEI